MFSLKSAITPVISSPRKQIGNHHIYPLEQDHP